MEPVPSQNLTDQLGGSHESYQILLRQLYGLPIELPVFLRTNGIEAEVIPFDQVASLKITLDPLLQPWAGPPSNPTQMIILALQDGRTVFVKAQFDPKTNQIYPPS